MMFERLHSRLAQIERAASQATPRAAARIQAKLREDATTKRGNVPAFGEMGSPITAVPVAEGVAVRAPGWVHDVAERRDQPAQWQETIADEVHRELESGA